MVERGQEHLGMFTRAFYHQFSQDEPRDTWKMLLDKMSQEDASFPKSSVSGMESGCPELSQCQDAGQ